MSKPKGKFTRVLEEVLPPAPVVEAVAEAVPAPEAPVAAEVGHLVRFVKVRRAGPHSHLTWVHPKTLARVGNEELVEVPLDSWTKKHLAEKSLVTE